jgi:creatinine amidohydrolase
MASTAGSTALPQAPEAREGPAPTVLAADLTWPDVQARLAQGCRIAVVPIGSCEQHGPPLPLGSDTYFICEAARRGAERAAAQAGAPVALVFPPLWYSNGDQWAPGEVWLRPSTIIALLVDVVAQLDRHGFRHIVLTTGHGGNPGIMADALREARERGVRAELFSVPPWAFIGDVIREVRETQKIGHACEIETSTSLYLFGDRVRTDRIAPGPEQPSYWAEISRYEAVRRGQVRQQGVSAGRIGEHAGFVGDPSKASAAKGERLVEAWVEGFAAFLRDLHASAAPAR